MGSQTGRQQVQEEYYGDPLSWTLLSSQDRLQTTHDTPLSSLPLLLHHHHDHSSFHASAGVCGSTQETPFGVCGIAPAQVSATAAQSLNHQHHYQNHNGNPNQVCNGEDFVGASGMGFVQASPHSRDATELNLGVSVAGATAKRPRSGNGGGGWSSQVPTCQVDGCWIDLSCAKHYYRRHRVCEYHSKSVAVNIAGRIQRFCQQCSRFHLLHDFDECKRSCRKRLEEHNRRRRKNNHPLENSDAGLVIHGEDQVGAIDVSGNSAYLNLYSPHFKPSQIVGEESSSRSVHDIEKPQHSDDCRLWVEVNSFAESSGITQGRKQQTQDERDDGTIRFASD